MKRLWGRFHGTLVDWCDGKNPWGRGAVLLFLAYVALRQIFDSDYVPLLWWVGAAIHEAGHFITLLFGWQFLMVAAGTLFEVGAPLALAWNFIRQRDVTGLTICGVWLGTQLFSVATYMADARAKELPFLRPFGLTPEGHDWEYLFTVFGVLRYDTAIAAATRVAGGSILILTLAFGAYSLWLMLRPQRDQTDDDEEQIINIEDVAE